MIIKNLEIITDENLSRLQAYISWNNSEFKKLFIAVPKEFGNYLDETSADPLIVAFIQIACKYEEDIIVENANVSKELADNIENILVPTLAKMKCGNGSTKIIANKIDEENKSEKVGATGISLGVDSFYSILKHLPNVDKSNFIKSVVFIYQVVKYENLDLNKLNELTISQKKVSEQLNLNLIYIITNIRNIIEEEFIFSQFHTFCNIGSVIALKKYLAYYYYATGYSDEEMKLNFSDCAYYENIIRKALTTSSFTMYSSGNNITRFEKTKYLSNFDIVKKNLLVCFYLGIKNCSTCHKCIRTLLTLDVLGCLNNFERIFDINLYNKNKNKYFGKLLYKSIINKDNFALEIYQNVKKYKYKIPISSWFYFFIIIVKRLIEKINVK